MKQERIYYKDVIALGFTETQSDDSVYLQQYGFPYCIVEKELTPTVHLEWTKETGFCSKITIDNKEDGNIIEKVEVKNLGELKRIVEEYENKIGLLPCPFCGGKCETEKSESGDNPTTYYRVNCENEHSLDWWEEDEQIAIQVWNKRPSKQ